MDRPARLAAQSLDLERRPQPAGRDRPLHAWAGLRLLGHYGSLKSSFQANGLDADRLRLEIAEIKEINQRLADEGIAFRLLTGVEVDILIACQLDLPDDVLAELDVVVASIHQGFNQGEAENTKRLICAAENRFVHMLGHMTGRLLLEREPYKVNAHAVIDACAATGTWIELNASPYRFDMDWRLWPYAKSKGVKCVINCDGHRNEHSGYLRLGAGVARKGWLTKQDVINTLPLAELKKNGNGRCDNQNAIAMKPFASSLVLGFRHTV